MDDLGTTTTISLGLFAQSHLNVGLIFSKKLELKNPTVLIG